ncbi:MAG: rRNA pseudouridine synthase [Lachnospiraceae bacterium]|nr:rRNA pseudouridine synthase [Lachnospiraceae bacterium]MDE6254049.1 rRNA pseudouridine synthase [Lachnospiraceae bacterium]
MMRLDKFLADMGQGTRSEVKTYIKKGMVKVNGTIAKRPELKINEKDDKVFISDKEVIYTRYEYFMLNKPSGYVSATEDRSEHTVLELITENLRDDLFPVGRLDKDTEGLLIISNDGDMAHRLLSPVNHVGKVYYARIDGFVTEEHVKIFSEGIDIGGGITTKPGILKILKSADESEIELKIYEGKFHQVKRMFEAVGMKVVYLKRISMGEIALDNSLKTGEFRRLTEEEVSRLKGLV